MKEKCLCCGYKTLPKKVEECICFICPVCFWENDIFMKNIYDTKEKSDSNGGMTLEEAQKALNNQYKDLAYLDISVRNHILEVKYKKTLHKLYHCQVFLK